MVWCRTPTAKFDACRQRGGRRVGGYRGRVEDLPEDPCYLQRTPLIARTEVAWKTSHKALWKRRSFCSGLTRPRFFSYKKNTLYRRSSAAWAAPNLKNGAYVGTCRRTRRSWICCSRSCSSG